MLAVQPEVAGALAAGEPVVALESTLVVHGLPRPRNLQVARELEATVRERGAVRATIAVGGGQARVGLEPGDLARLDGAPKLSVRDLAIALARGDDGATTVASTATLAARAGIRVFATGGLGGVHREARETWDESADLEVLARTPVTVVAAGVKSILDVGATLERLETLSVPVVGFRTQTFPGFYLTDSGHPLDWRVEEPEQVAAIMRAQERLGLPPAALVVANPVDPARQLDPALHERALAGALAAAATARGKAVTPLMLARFAALTEGASVEVNVDVVVGNAALAAEIAVAWATAG